MATQDPAEKGGQAALRSQKVSAAQIQVYLKGIDYPVNKQQLIDHAKSRGAPENVMAFMDRMPEREYKYPTDVQEEFGKMK